MSVISASRRLEIASSAGQGEWENGGERERGFHIGSWSSPSSSILASKDLREVGRPMYSTWGIQNGKGLMKMVGGQGIVVNIGWRLRISV